MNKNNKKKYNENNLDNKTVYVYFIVTFHIYILISVNSGCEDYK